MRSGHRDASFRECCERFTRRITRWPRSRPGDMPSNDHADRVTPLSGTQLTRCLQPSTPTLPQSRRLFPLTLERSADRRDVLKQGTRGPSRTQWSGFDLLDLSYLTAHLQTCTTMRGGSGRATEARTRMRLRSGDRRTRSASGSCRRTSRGTRARSRARVMAAALASAKASQKRGCLSVHLRIFDGSLRPVMAMAA